MNKLEKFSLAMLAIVGVLIFVACTELTDNSELSETSNARDYHYGDDVRINEGFYKGYGCVVLREYRHTLFCQIVVTEKDEHVQDEYKAHINLPKKSVTLIP